MSVCYLDSSVLLRDILAQPGRMSLDGLNGRALTSELAFVECRRVLDRIRLLGKIAVPDLQIRRERLDHLNSALIIKPLDQAAIMRASDPMDWPLGTLDAIHLATALNWRDEHGEAVDFATHDIALAQAARQYGCRVLGVGAN